MDFKAYSHRHALTLFNSEEPFASLWTEIAESIEDVSDESIVELFESDYEDSKSISAAVNRLLAEQFVARGWVAESPIFADEVYSVRRESRWRLDFAKDMVSIEVAFNHGEAAAWNLLKPVLASELNHVEKAIQTQAGVVITATEAMKKAGGFDSAVGTYEKYVQYMQPLNNILTVPVVLIGLEAPETFEISLIKRGRRYIGEVRTT